MFCDLKCRSGYEIPLSPGLLDTLNSLKPRTTGGLCKFGLTKRKEAGIRSGCWRLVTTCQGQNPYLTSKSPCSSLSVVRNLSRRIALECIQEKSECRRVLDWYSHVVEIETSGHTTSVR